MPLRFAPFLPLLLGCLPGPAGADPVGPGVRLAPSPAMPDLCQSDPAGGFPENGRMYCAPVAVSNSMMALFGEELKWEGVTQVEVVKQLASVGYMNTHRKHGTHLNQFLRGVRRFVEERGVKDFSVRFQGYLKHDREFGPHLRRPQLRWIQGHLAKGGAAWLCVGWYTYNPETKEYTRTGSHWVTVVGYGENARGEPDPDVLIIHDPAPAAGRREQREYVTLDKLSGGTIVGAVEEQDIRAAGIYRLGGGMHIHPDAELALLDGVVGLNIRDRGGRE